MITSTMQAPPVRLCLSADGRAAVAELEKLIVAWRGGREGKSLSEKPMGEVSHWSRFVQGGWQRIGIELGDGQVTPLRDLIAVAELLGAELIALPALGTVLAHRWVHQSGKTLPGVQEPDARLSVAVPISRSSALIPFGQSAAALMQRAGQTHWSLEVAQASAGVRGDNFAETLPLLVVQESVSLDERQLREAVLLFAASAVGCAHRCLWRSVEYARERQAYGQPIGAFQAIKHLLADMYRDTELARSGVIGAEHERDWLALTLHCVELARRVTAHSIQVHGGIGFTWDTGLHFHSRHVLAVSKLVTAVAANN